MNALSTVDMKEATRLTREGRLMEAMAILQGAPPPKPATASSCQDSQRPLRSATIIDLDPPSTAGGAWAAPASGRASEGTAWQAPFPKAGAGLSESLLSRTLGRTTMGAASVGTRTPLVDGARFEDRTFADSAGSRAYKLYVPNRFSGQPLPLVVMLHGCTQSPDDFAAGTQMNVLAEEMLFLVAYPAQPQSANAQKCWNWFNAGDQRRDQGEPALIAGITRQIMREFPVAEGRVYIAGLSAGGAAAAIMGSTYSDLYAAIGVHSGLACGAASDMPSAFSAMRQGGKPKSAGLGLAVPTIVFHGDRDPTVNAVNADQVIVQSQAGAKLRVEIETGLAKGGLAYTRTVHRDLEDKAVLEQWLLHGAGHAWSGGSSAGSYTDPRGPDASREMVRFFLNHQTRSVAKPPSMNT